MFQGTGEQGLETSLELPVGVGELGVRGAGTERLVCHNTLMFPKVLGDWKGSWLDNIFVLNVTLTLTAQTLLFLRSWAPREVEDCIH